MTASLPSAVQAVFDRFITTEFTTVDRRGQPITWPVTPYYSPGAPCIDVTTGLGYPKKATDARSEPRVALLFSDPSGSGLERAPMVLVQGIANVDDADLEANRARYDRESAEKLPASQSMQPPSFMRRFLSWYYTRIYVHVRPERIYAWPEGDVSREPELLGAHLDEVRSGHSEEPPAAHAGPQGGAPTWDERIDELGARYRHAVVSFLAPDGFPFAVRLPVSVDRGARRIRIGALPAGAPLEPGLACVTAHDHAVDFTWQRDFQVRGDLVEDDDGWSLLPHGLIGGFELPPTSMLARYRMNAAKIRRFRGIAKRELVRREART